MQDVDLYQRLREAVDDKSNGADVDVGLSPDKHIIMLTGRVPSRGVQISIEDAVERLAGDFTIINLVKVDPHLGRPAIVLH